MNAYLFPGQGSQFPGMGQTLYDNHAAARKLFERANEMLGFSITHMMFTGTADELQQTHVTQPAIFLHSVILAAITPNFQPDKVAGHSLGELSALVASQSLSFEDGLRLIAVRAQAMQAACEQNPGKMAAVLGLDDATVEAVCNEVDAIVAPANYNCPGQLVISGTIEGVDQATDALQAAGAKRVVPLPVSGGFHSTLMQPAQEAFAQAVANTAFKKPICPIYQNIDAMPTTDPELIKAQLIQQLTAPIRWTQTIQQMSQDGANRFVVCGPGQVIQGLVKKIKPDAVIETVEN